MGLETPTYIADLNAAWPLGSDTKQAGDDHLRNIKAAIQATFPGMVGAFARVQTKGAGYTPVANDNTSLIDCSAALTLSLTAAATLGNKWMIAIYARGGDVIIDPNSTEQVNGASTFTVPTGYLALLWCNGSAFYVGLLPTSASGGSAVRAIWLPAKSFVPTFTNGAQAGTIELATNDIMLDTYNFDSATAEYIQTQIQMPDSWNEGTVQFRPLWTHPSTTTNFGVVFEFAANSVSNDDALDTALGTAQTSTDTGGTTDDLYIGPLCSALTIGGSPQAQDLVTIRVGRLPSNGSDTLAVDARLIGVTMLYTDTGAADA